MIFEEKINRFWLTSIPPSLWQKIIQFHPIPFLWKISILTKSWKGRRWHTVGCPWARRRCLRRPLQAAQGRHSALLSKGSPGKWDLITNVSFFVSVVLLWLHRSSLISKTLDCTISYIFLVFFYFDPLSHIWVSTQPCRQQFHFIFIRLLSTWWCWMSIIGMLNVILTTFIEMLIRIFWKCFLRNWCKLKAGLPNNLAALFAPILSLMSKVEILYERTTNTNSLETAQTSDKRETYDSVKQTSFTHWQMCKKRVWPNMNIFIFSKLLFKNWIWKNCDLLLKFTRIFLFQPQQNNFLMLFMSLCIFWMFN